MDAMPRRPLRRSHRATAADAAAAAPEAAAACPCRPRDPRLALLGIELDGLAMLLPARPVAATAAAEDLFDNVPV
jgi:hypothetical protein